MISRQLVQLVRDVPIEIDWDASHVGGMDRDGVLRMCARVRLSGPARATGGFADR